MNDYHVIAFGGECSHWARIPLKATMLPGEAVHSARKGGECRIGRWPAPRRGVSP
jgi:hypothetical protein